MLAIKSGPSVQNELNLFQLAIEKTTGKASSAMEQAGRKAGQAFSFNGARRELQQLDRDVNAFFQTLARKGRVGSLNLGSLIDSSGMIRQVDSVMAAEAALNDYRRRSHSERMALLNQEVDTALAGIRERQAAEGAAFRQATDEAQRRIALERQRIAESAAMVAGPQNLQGVTINPAGAQQAATAARAYRFEVREPAGRVKLGGGLMIGQSRQIPNNACPPVIGPFLLLRPSLAGIFDFPNGCGESRCGRCDQSILGVAAYLGQPFHLGVNAVRYWSTTLFMLVVGRHPLVLIAIFAGLRASELRGLPWRSIDLKAATINVDQRADLKNDIGPPKSEAGYRTIPLPASAIAALTAWKLACPPTDDGLVFPSVAKRVMAHRYMNLNLMGSVQLAAGISAPALDADGKAKLDDKQQPILEPRYTLHDFRHAAASLWIAQRVNPKRVQKWMGHGSIQVTFDTYGHLFDQADQDAAVAAAIEHEILSQPT
ncbi:MAG TPA: site-specific integrase [Sphingobium sp.]|uniref:site-specific integrase n=1 Tax=Sphingobium sp. TaxID=1912891 RepID=UPI002ED0FA12